MLVKLIVRAIVANLKFVSSDFETNISPVHCLLRMVKLNEYEKHCLFSDGVNIYSNDRASTGREKVGNFQFGFYLGKLLVAAFVLDHLQLPLGPRSWRDYRLITPTVTCDYRSTPVANLSIHNCCFAPVLEPTIDRLLVSPVNTDRSVFIPNMLLLVLANAAQLSFLPTITDVLPWVMTTACVLCYEFVFSGLSALFAGREFRNEDEQCQAKLDA